MRDERGSISIFVSLMFLVFMSVVFFCIDGVRIIYGDTKVDQTIVGANEHILAHYHKELQERYHLFFLDPAFMSERGVEKEIKEYLEKSICPLQRKNNLYSFQIQDISFVKEIYPDEENLTPLKHQIREYMKYKQVSNWTDEFLSKITVLKEKDREEEETRKLLETQQKEVEAQEKIEIEQEIPEEVENLGGETEEILPQPEEDPREIVEQALDGGILKFVLPEGKAVSSRKLVGKGLPSEELKNMQEQKNTGVEIDFGSLKPIQNLFSEEKVATAIENITTEGTSIAYLMNLFSHYAKKAKKGAATQLDYEIEYVIQGEKTDKENLEGVVHKILLFRFGTNFSYALTNASLNTQALTVATAIAGVAGIPPITIALKTMILAAISYGEAMLDVRSLMDGNKIPILKNQMNWKLSVEGIGQLLDAQTEGASDENGMEYEDFLKLFLLTQSKKDIKYGRMLDLMQENIRIKEKGFSILEALFGYEVYCRIGLKSLFGNGTKIFEVNRSCSY